MKKLSVIFIGLLILVFVGYSNKETGNESIAKEYVEAKGYKITEYEGEIERYTSQEQVTGLSFQQWSKNREEKYSN